MSVVIDVLVYWMVSVVVDAGTVGFMSDLLNHQSSGPLVVNCQALVVNVDHKPTEFEALTK
jgi:hypothetical protein